MCQAARERSFSRVRRTVLRLIAVRAVCELKPKLEARQCFWRSATTLAGWRYVQNIQNDEFTFFFEQTMSSMLKSLLHLHVSYATKRIWCEMIIICHRQSSNCSVWNTLQAPAQNLYFLIKYDKEIYFISSVSVHVYIENLEQFRNTAAWKPRAWALSCELKTLFSFVCFYLP